MEKYLVTIEFSYMDVPESNLFTGHKNKTITIGVYDNEEDAISDGNKALEVFEKHFALNPHYNTKERFSKNGGCFGSPNYLISNMTWITTPFAVYAKITVLYCQDVEKTINYVLDAEKRYNEYLEKKDNDE